MTNTQSDDSGRRGSPFGGEPAPQDAVPVGQWAQPEADPRSKELPPPPWWADVFGVVAALAAVAVAALLLVTGPGGNFVYDTGMAGTPGTYTATSCWTTGSGKNTEDYCAGTFTSTDGTVVVRDVQLEGTRASVGHPITLRRESDGTDYAQPGFANATMDVAVCLAVLAGLGFVITVIGVWPRSVVVRGAKEKDAEQKGAGEKGAGRNDEDAEQPREQAPTDADATPGRRTRFGTATHTRDGRPRPPLNPSPWRQLIYTGLVLVLVSFPLAACVAAVGLVAQIVSRI